MLWVSNQSDSAAGAPTVMFGLSPNRMSYSADGTSHTFNRTALCHQPIVDWAWIEPGWVHDVVVDAVSRSQGAIQYGDKVYYTVGAGGRFNKKVSWFYVPIPPGLNPNADFTWIMVRPSLVAVRPACWVLICLRGVRSCVSCSTLTWARRQSLGVCSAACR